jgi:phosphoribosylglycinamide formyltransferase-1
MKASVAILISGRGSNFLALHEAMERQDLPAKIGLILSNNSEAGGLALAQSLKLPTCCLPHGDEMNREAHEAKVLRELERAGVEWICLAGYMRILSAAFVARYPQRILNIHPSLLPAFPGLDAQAHAIEHGVQVSGCTVHLVDEHLDHGPIVLQRAVRLRANDTTASLSSRILRVEHEAYPRALARLLSEPWEVVGRRINFLPNAADDS